MAISIAKNKIIHFIGIGGVGMSAIAQVLLEKGYKVSGSDVKESLYTIRLKGLGAGIFYTQEAANLRKASAVVVSSAITPDNPEYAEALRTGLPIIKRAQMLNFIMMQYPQAIAVAGTHGKTTTASMITKLLHYKDIKPSFLIGADVLDFGSNAGLGNSSVVVAEADESDGSFLELNPTIGVITNIEAEHMAYFKTIENLEDHFKRFIDKIVARNGYVVACFDDPVVRKLAGHLDEAHLISYGITEPAMLTGQNIQFKKEKTEFEVLSQGQLVGAIQLQRSGYHSVRNALASIAIGLREKIPFATIRQTLGEFMGAKRRFQLIGESRQIRIYDDYAHHPTEIKSTLEGAKLAFPERLICIFQPHRYSRTQELLKEFWTAFDLADITVITDIYSAFEAPIPGISAEKVVEGIQAQKTTQVMHIPNKSKIIETILPILNPNDVVIAMGAGDIHSVAKALYVELKEQTKRHAK